MSTLLPGVTTVADSDAAAELMAGYRNYTSATELTFTVGESYQELVGKSITTATNTIQTMTVLFGCQRN